MQEKPVSDDVDAAMLAKRTAGFSGAELSNLVNEAALAAGKGGLAQITPVLLDEAHDKVLMGSERRCLSAPLPPLPWRLRVNALTGFCTCCASPRSPPVCCTDADHLVWGVCPLSLPLSLSK